MNRRWTLAAIAPVAALVAFGVVQAISSSAAPARGLLVEGVSLRVAAALGCLIAASQFDRGDHMRRAWSAMGFCYVLVVANAVLFGTATHAGARALSETASAMSGVLVVVANLCTVVGGLMVARTWRVAGLEMPYSAPVRMGALLASLLVGLAIAGPATSSDLAAVFHGNYEALASLASDLGDIVSLAVLAPILLTALSLRGGSLAWPWALMVSGTFGWLLLDATGTLVSALHADPQLVRPLEEAFRAFACFSYVSAGLLQREVMRVPVLAGAPQT